MMTCCSDLIIMEGITMKRMFASLLVLASILLIVGCGGTSEESDVLHVGLIVSASGANDNGYNEFAIEGLNAVAEKYPIETKVVDNADDVPGALTLLATAGYDLIFSLEYNFDALINNDGSGKSIAEQYPETTFVIFNAFANTAEDGSKIQPNVVEVLFSVNEGSFLAGALSVLTNENASILFGDDYNFVSTDEARAVGFLGGTASSGISVFGNGFISGVDYEARKLGVTYDYYSDYAAGFTATPAVAQTIATYYDAGCNILYAAAGGVAVPMRNEAKKAGRLCVDVDANQDAQVPGTILTSVLKNTDVPVFDIAEKLVNGELEAVSGTDIYYSLDSGATGITDLSVIESFVRQTDEAQAVWADIKAEIESLEQQIGSGAIDVVDAQSGEELDWTELENVVRKN